MTHNVFKFISNEIIYCVTVIKYSKLFFVQMQIKNRNDSNSTDGWITAFNEFYVYVMSLNYIENTKLNDVHRQTIP